MMTDARRSGATPELEIQQILLEAKHRWLRPAEICEILQNYQKFRISPEPPHKPPSGSLFLFDRKVLRFFRRDGHNWRKKRDGKTIKEAHERLKAGSVDVLHCYYAHGEENENFQRRAYWLLEEDFMHIVLVHYLEVKGSKSSYVHSRDVGVAQGAHAGSPVSSSSFTSQSQLPSHVIGSPDSTQTSEYEDAESDNYKSRSRYYSFPELQQYEPGPMMDAPFLDSSGHVSTISEQCDSQRFQEPIPKSDLYSVAQEDMAHVFNAKGPDLTFGVSKHIDLTSWEAVLNNCTPGLHNAHFQPIDGYTQAAILGDNLKGRNMILEELFSDDLNINQDDVAVAEHKSVWQIYNDEVGSLVQVNLDLGNDMPIKGDMNFLSFSKQESLNLSNTEEDRLKKYDSFTRWMSKELGDVDISHLNTNSGIGWIPDESGDIIDSRMPNQEHLYTYLMSTSISQEQLYSIVDFFPNWAYANLKTKVLVTGKFLKNKPNIEKCRWSCMFGEVEVPSEVLADGSLSCYAPSHKSGRVPFYITCSDRLACSEVREFEFRDSHTRYMEPSDYSSLTEMNLHIRLENLLCIKSFDKSKHVSGDISEKSHLNSKVSLLMTMADDGWFNTVTHEQGSTGSAIDYLCEQLLKEKLLAWLVQKAVEEGKGPSVLDKEGQGVIHLAAALGYDWAIKPTVIAGVSVNFRDAHGWTALHWAAFCGREHTVASLLALGAASGAITDPTPEFPSGRTAADLASVNEHKGIAGFLAESSLISHLSALTLKDSESSHLAEGSHAETIEDVVNRGSVQLKEGDTQSTYSLGDSLNAVRNAAQAASRIYQVYRVHSFCRKKHADYGDDRCGISDGCALSLVSRKTSKLRQDMPKNAAATRIQNKFRGWKGRKDFLIFRQRIVKIQAHVRGHQARKQYKKFVWSVGIVEKVILRWRRKGSGLRGFRSEGLLEGATVQKQPSRDDDYDFLQEGRKQTEARLEKALARVKSMVQYPEARDQYRRLLTVVTELQKSKDMQESILNETEDAADVDLMIEELLDEDTLMSTGV